jgi:ubiquinone/menaquinone biosynthesis C-methylase UbiE
VTASEREVISQEFTRSAEGFAARTRGRFDALDIVEFASVRSGETVIEVGGGTGNFLALFADDDRVIVNLDITPKMLDVSRSSHPEFVHVQGDGARLPFRSSSIDLVTSAQALHHVQKPLPLLEEMRRVARPKGRVLIVDQCATERYEEAVAMNELEIVRDPSHAASRPPSAFRTLLTAAGLQIVDERVANVSETFSEWMSPGEFPRSRIDEVLRFIEEHGPETGMEFRRVDGEWVFTRRRIMLLASDSHNS